MLVAAAVAAALLAAASAASAAEFGMVLPRKSLAGPPSEFASMQLPTPLDGSLVSESFVSDVRFTQVSGAGVTDAGAIGSTPSEFQFHDKVVVDSKTAFSLTTAIPVPAGGILTAELVSPTGARLDLAQHTHESKMPIGNEHIPATTYLFTKNIEVGVYALTLTLRTPAGVTDLGRLTDPKSAIAHGRILLWNQSPTAMHAHLNTYALVTDRDVGLVAQLAESSTVVDGERPSVVRAAQVTAKIDVTLPDGQSQVVTMHDDGLHGDGDADDGIFAGSMRASEVGLYSMTGILEGVMADGTQFRRSTEHLVPVSSLEVELDGTAHAKWATKANETRRASRALGAAPNTEETLDIFVGVKPRAVYQRVNRKFRAYAEVYGKDAAGSDVAVAWISSMVDVVDAPAHMNTGASTMGFHLTLDSGWVSAATAKAPYTLKNVVLQDSQNYVPETDAASVPVTMASCCDRRAAEHAARPLTLADVHHEWKVGRDPRPALAANTKAKSGIVLLHGYCSATNPWEHQTADWTDGYYFLNPSASIGNDEFATLVAEFVDQNKLDTFGLVGHSQGGLVSAHLYNYYFTGLDGAEANGRLIQSVGSPYEGCSAAGSIANLGQVFGIGCGENLDLSKDASRLWLAGLSDTTFEAMYYYTTTYKLGNFFGDWCSLPMNAILSYPNDGTSELKYTTPSEKAHNMGNTEKQCHTTDMGYSPQYWDTERNAQMNTAASR